MQDAVILINCIYDIEDVTHENIKAALADYRTQRCEHAASQVKVSQTLGKLMYGQVSASFLQNWLLLVSEPVLLSLSSRDSDYKILVILLFSFFLFPPHMSGHAMNRNGASALYEVSSTTFQSGYKPGIT
jgi:hypothetical protein